jgi:hypothetical protein
MRLQHLGIESDRGSRDKHERPRALGRDESASRRKPRQRRCRCEGGKHMCGGEGALVMA